MPILQKIISDITEKEINREEVIKIYKSFGYCSDYDLGELSIYTTKKELEELFKKEIFEDNKIYNCFSCDKDIIEDCRKSDNQMGVWDLKSFFDYVNERSLNIDDLHIDICNKCIKKYFEKYISYDEY
ncbi:MAG: hypothetical protein Q9M94_01880 [Candidatus Gracilibacteria bacterium]|nr:hypothetical protein [Candidatus Gracilibacteria bacterium]